MDALPITNAVAHAVLQLGAGITAGVIIDFSVNRLVGKRAKVGIHSPTDAALEILEVTGQIVAGSIILAGVMNYIASLELAFADPTSGFIFAQSFFGAQAGLLERIQRITVYIKNTFLRAETKMEEKLLEPDVMDGSRGRGIRNNLGSSRVQERNLFVRTGQVPYWVTDKQ